jgi:HD-like signal output (HDOD) protein
MLAGLIHSIGVLPILIKAEEIPELLNDSNLLDDVIEKLHTKIGKAILESWDFPANLVSVASDYNNYDWDSENGPDLVDVVQVAVIQSRANTEKAVPTDKLDSIKSFKKLGIETGMTVEELDEDSEEYAEALALFSGM